jgi:hypothetical protein
MILIGRLITILPWQGVDINIVINLVEIAALSTVK